MKKSIIYLTISATLTFSGCDYLDDMPYDWAQPDDIFTNEQNYLKPINRFQIVLFIRENIIRLCPVIGHVIQIITTGKC